jgi:hypothetical protein
MELKSYMKDPYIRIKSIFDREVKQSGFMTTPNTIWFSVNTPEFNEFVQILHADDIKLRQKDGVPRRSTLSIPISIEHTIVLGTRYQKRDHSYSEDTVIFEPGKAPEALYKGEIQRHLLEYKGTHKRQSDY